MTIPKNVLALDPGLDRWSILTAYRGSIAHLMYVPKNDPNSIDDKDVIACCVPPPEYYFGLESYGSRGTKEVKQDEWDIVIYEARKLVGLMLKGNPNVLTILWTGENKLIHNTNAGRYLRDNKHLFVGRHCYHSFVGYAHGQLHRMTHMATDEAYMGAKRRALVEKVGYDSKNAAHLIRLLRMGIEFLKDGELYVERVSDNNELLDIKRGEWPLEKVKAEAERLFALAEEAYVRSTLPKEPDRAAVNNLCIEVVQMAHTERTMIKERTGVLS